MHPNTSIQALESLHFQFGLIHQQMGDILASLKGSATVHNVHGTADDVKTKTYPKPDPLWFNGTGNNHLSDLGKKKLRELLEQKPKLGHGEIGRIMSIHRNAVTRWAEKWDLK